MSRAAPPAIAAIACVLALTACDRSRAPASTTRLTSAEQAAPAPQAEPPRAPPDADPEPEPVVPIHVEEIPVADDLSAFAVRGARMHRVQMLFLAGMCVHPAGYIESFQRTAASRGDLLALQADVSCGGDGAMRRWSSDLEAMDRRIDAAFHASGLGEPHDVVVIGYSQGAQRAESLVARWPHKYSRAILLGSPVVPSPRNLSRARSVVLMAGTHDMAIGTHKTAVQPLRRASIPSTFIELEGARHGEMGPDPERTMESALDFVEHSPDPDS